MSDRTRSRGARRCGVALVLGLATLAAPTAAQAAEVNLATANPFSVLGGVSVSNTGPSVLGGDLGVSPGNTTPGYTALMVGGAIHAGDATALQAQADLTAAYGVAAGEPSSSNRTGTDTAGQTLIPGTYTWSSDANLTGPLTLDGQGDANSRFIFQIGSALDTGTGFSVALTGGASACNVYWQVGSSATLGTTNAFVGTIMANNSISLDTGTTVLGRALARVGSVTTDTNTFTDPGCAAGQTTTQGTPATPATSGPTTPIGFPGAGNAGPGNAGNQPPPASRTTRRLRRGTSTLRRTTNPAPGATCTRGFTARVRGSYVKSVVFRLDGKRVSTRRRSPFSAYVKAAGAGKHKVTATVTYRDATRAVTRTLRYRGCAAAALQPRRGPSQFTG
jgi:hypothetical protein